MSPEKGELLGGAVKREDRVLKDSPVVAIEPRSSQEVVIPKNWALLTHGTNLGKIEWAGEKTKQLDENILIVGKRGLSVVGERERKDVERQKEYLKQQGIGSGSFSTTEGYSTGGSNILIINVIFPEFNSREKEFKDIRGSWVKKHGQETANSFAEIVDQVYWKNIQSGRHPILPNGFVLKKVEDKITDGKRLITYIPESLIDLYNSEINTQ